MINILLGREVTSLKRLIHEEMNLSKILFPPEADNPRREKMVDILNASNALKSLPLTTVQLQGLERWLEYNVENWDINSNIEWWSGKGPIFAHLLVCLSVIENLKHRNVDVRKAENKFKIVSHDGIFHNIITEFQDITSLWKKMFFIKVQ